MYRGRPLPMTIREFIRERLGNRVPIKVLARTLGLSKNTVKKYRPKNKFDPLRKIAG